MMFNKMFYFSDFSYMNHWWGGLFVILAIWSLFWKGAALWKSARGGDKAWFVVLLIVNTLGVLDILYIHLFSKKTLKKGKK